MPSLTTLTVRYAGRATWRIASLSQFRHKARAFVHPLHLGAERDRTEKIPARGDREDRYDASMGSPAIRALFIIDPLDTLIPDADSSYVMMREALSRGHEVWTCTIRGLYIDAQGPSAQALPLEVNTQGQLQHASPSLQAVAMKDLDVVIMRKDPPFDESYLTATWILSCLSKDTLVINDPSGLRDLNEKIAIFAFPQFAPPTQIARTPEQLRATLETFGGDMIVKPVLGFGGRGILRAREEDPNLSTLLELATQEGERFTVAQAFLPEAQNGDKRILLVDGKVSGAVLRVPARGELRGNLHVGGRAEKTDLSSREQEICAAVGPYLRDRGQFFVGIDVIGDYLTEVNVTSPTGMQEINRLNNLQGPATMEAVFWDALEARL